MALSKPGFGTGLSTNFPGLGGAPAAAVDTGWKRLMLEDAVGTEDPLSQVASLSETSGQSGYTQVTLSDVINTGALRASQACTYTQPLQDASGVTVNWDKPFTLMCMIEMISATGNYGGTNKAKFLVGMGIGVNATGVDHVDNRWVNMGLNQNGSTFPTGMRITKGARSYQQHGSNNGVADTKLLVFQFYHGPDTGASMAAANNTCVMGQWHKDSGNAYRRNPINSFYRGDLGALATNAVKATGPVQLFTYVGSSNTLDGTKDQAVVKFRLWYMIAHDTDGWGGSAT